LTFELFFKFQHEWNKGVIVRVMMFNATFKN
jgi:hypothetical protein